MNYELPQLNYSFDAFEPHIDEETMKLHYLGHHQAYVNKLNETLNRFPEIKDIPLQELLASIENLPVDARQDIRNHGGGHYNHTFFWSILSPQKTSPGKNLLAAINSQFQNFSNFIEIFSDRALKHFGSGYAWLSINRKGRLVVESLPNQDTPLVKGCEPLFLLDLWEHAYYLKYRNKRADFVKIFWNIVNWGVVEQKFMEARYRIETTTLKLESHNHMEDTLNGEM